MESWSIGAGEYWVMKFNDSPASLFSRMGISTEREKSFLDPSFSIDIDDDAAATRRFL